MKIIRRYYGRPKDLLNKHCKKTIVRLPIVSLLSCLLYCSYIYRRASAAHFGASKIRHAIAGIC